MPFGRNLAPGMLHRHAARNEAVARLAWCISGRRPAAASISGSA
jgi:type II secretory pathway predicted ATPase ExeA